MSGRLLTFEDGEIRLGGETVPGLFDGVRIRGDVRFDEQEIDGASGTARTPKGFETCAIEARLVLVTDADSDGYAKLTAINALFRGVDGRANPQVLEVANRHIQARGIRRVVFAHLESEEDTHTDEIWVTLGFVEHNPPIIRTEKAQAKTPTPAEVAAQSAAKTAAADAVANGQYPDSIFIDER